MTTVTSQGGTATAGPSASPGYVTWIRVVAGASGAVASLFAVFTGDAVGNVKLGLYSDSSGGPGALLAESAAANNPAAGTVVFAPGAAVAVANNAAYWIGILCDAAMPIGGDSRLFAYVPRSYAADFPASGTGFSTYSGVTSTGVGMSIAVSDTPAVSTPRVSQSGFDVIGANPLVAGQASQSGFDVIGSAPVAAAASALASVFIMA